MYDCSWLHGCIPLPSTQASPGEPVVPPTHPLSHTTDHCHTACTDAYMDTRTEPTMVSRFISHYIGVWTFYLSSEIQSIVII